MFQNLFVGFGVTDVIDILIVAFIIYTVLEFIQQSRAEQLIKGIIILLLIAGLAQLLHLYTLTWILRAVFEVGLLALVILFQPELRRGLDRLGRGRFFRRALGFDSEEAEEITAEMARAVTHMSASRTGALIVFEQRTSLSELLGTGTILDAAISAPAVENIFYKGSPLHDGALLVRGDRLCAAGLVLPLSQQMDLPASLGTRHRAAIGVSEISDAAVLVVSEETGIISWVKDGAIERPLTAEELEKKLRDLFLGNKKREGKDGTK